MQQRSLFSASGAARTALLAVAAVDWWLTSCVAVALFVAPDDVHSLLLFGLQLPHLFTLLLAATVVGLYRRAHLMTHPLYVAYLLAFAGDVVGVIGHGILAYKAEAAREARNEVFFAALLALSILADGLGFHFADRLRDCFAHEGRYLASLADGSRKP